MMSRTAIFAGLILDEFNNPVEVAYIGDEACYVVDDQGFKRHISAAEVDRKIYDLMTETIKTHEDLFTEQTLKMIGQDDLFTRAVVQNQLKNLDKQFENLQQAGIPEEGKTYMGMMGFKVIIDMHGEIIEIVQPGRIDEGE